MSAITRLAIVVCILMAGLLGGSVAGWIGAGFAVVAAAAVTVVNYHGQPMWAWVWLYLRRHRPIEFVEPVTVVNDRSGGGVRYQEGIAAVALQILGKAYQPTLLTGSNATTDNTIDLRDVLPVLQQPLGLHLASLNLVVSGSRRQHSGDYPRVYDTLIGTPPYAGQREMWLVVRLSALENADALRYRTSVGTAVVSAGQRVAAALRCNGIRARVATATDIVELERRIGRSALEPQNRCWRSTRSDSGWLTTYAYRPADITSDALNKAWSLRVDGVTQNLMLFPDGTVAATITVRTTQPPTVPPSVGLRSLPGEQAAAIAGSLCGPAQPLRGVSRGALPKSLVLPVGPSGVLMGKVQGDRFLLPFGDPADTTRIRIATDDVIAKRLIIRAAAAGDRITVHTRDAQRWESIRMPHIAITDQAKPVRGTTLSVVDGTVSPSPRPNTIVAVTEPGSISSGSTDISIIQTDLATVEVVTAGHPYNVEVELFRAENRYLSTQPVERPEPDHEFAY